MFLLNQGVIEPNIDFATFTFHYVSIKSKKMIGAVKSIANLHSTMFLLNRNLTFHLAILL